MKKENKYLAYYLVLVLFALFLGSCEKEDDVKPPHVPQITYKMTAYSTSLNQGNNWMSMTFLVDFDEEMADTVRILNLVEKWEYRFNPPHEVFMPKIINYSRNCVQGYDSVVWEIYNRDTLYWRKSI